MDWSEMISVFLFISYLLALHSNLKKRKEILLLKGRVVNYGQSFVTMSKELKDIMALNKYCIERWEKSVHEKEEIVNHFITLTGLDPNKK